MNVLCLDGYSEVLCDDRESTELVLESLVASLLVEFFDTVIVDQVGISHMPATSPGQSLREIQFEAICAAREACWPLETLEIQLENALCCALIELFSDIHVHTIHVHQEQEVSQRRSAANAGRSLYWQHSFPLFCRA
jgi:hypothetical protein